MPLLLHQFYGIHLFLSWLWERSEECKQKLAGLIPVRIDLFLILVRTTGTSQKVEGVLFHTSPVPEHSDQNWTEWNEIENYARQSTTNN